MLRVDRRIAGVLALLPSQAVVGVIAACGQAADRPAELPTAPPPPSAHVEFLASGALSGRGYLHGGQAVAARYIREHFVRASLTPAGNDYFQPFGITPDHFPSEPQLEINGRKLALGTDFVPIVGSPSATVADARTHAVGHGITRESPRIDDFAVFPPGAAAIVESGLPDSIDAASLPAGALRVDAKAVRAADAGASCLIEVVDRLIYDISTDDIPIPAFRVLRTALPPHDEVERISCRVETRRNVLTEVANVAGVVSGTDPAAPAVLLSAHYDHLGGIGDSLFFPGANDNASGVALLLDLAYHYAINPPRRTLVFAAFAAEELGLLGARYFVAYPRYPLESIGLVLNFDMVASGEDGIVVSGGSDHPDLFGKLEAVASSTGAGPIRARATTPISDHYPFSVAGVPAFYLYTSGGLQPYHHVNDHPGTLEWDDYLVVRELVVAFIDELD